MIHMKYQHEKVQILSHLEIIVLPNDGYEIFIYIRISKLNEISAYK